MTKKIAVSLNTFLASPKLEDMTVFLDSVERSSTLHHPWVTPPSNQEGYIAYLKRTNTQTHRGFFIKCNTTQKIIGVVNINEIVRGAFQSGYLGYYVFTGFNGQGLMSEGFSLVVCHAFDVLNLHRLEANIQPDNENSIAFIKKHGFRHEGFSPKYLKINNQWKDHERFAITADE